MSKDKSKHAFFFVDKKTSRLQAMTEGEKQDYLTQQGVRATLTPSIRGNNYTSYESQVLSIYEMYNAKSEYGSGILGGLVDSRTAFIGGAGLSIVAKKAGTQKFIDNLMNYNQMYGSRFINAVRMGEMEGKCLLNILPYSKDQQLKIRLFSWMVNRYSITVDPMDTDNITSITYKEKKKDGEQKSINAEKSVYVKLGGTTDKIDETPCKIGKILTQVENYERALYDLRANNHIFGLLILGFECKDDNEAQAIYNKLDGQNISEGFTYAGTAKMYFLSPSPESAKVIENEMLLNAKIIAQETDIPIHWLSWLELINAKATSENMLEVINAGTLPTRLIWEEKIKELVRKCMAIASELKLEGAVNDPDGFEVKLPLVSISMLKALTEVWLPLQQSDVISMATLRNMIPGIEPNVEKKMIDDEKEENMQRFENNLDTNPIDENQDNQNNNLNKQENNNNDNQKKQ